MSTFFANLERLRPTEFKNNDAGYARFLGLTRTRYFDWKLKHEAGRQFTPNQELQRQCAERLSVSLDDMWQEPKEEARSKAS